MSAEQTGFIFGLAALIIEPIITRIPTKYVDEAKLASLGLLLIGILFLIGSVPSFLKSLGLSLVYFVPVFAVMLFRYVWQFKADRREMKNKNNLWYSFIFLLGLAVIGIFVYAFTAFSLIEIIFQTNIIK